MFKWGVGIGFGLFAISFAVIKYAVKTYEMFLNFSPWLTILLTGLAFLICLIGVRSKINSEVKNSIVENIREL